jgi:hypothetical protein
MRNWNCILLAALILATTCIGHAQPGQAAFSLHLSSQQSTLKLGDSIRLVITIKNISEKALDLPVDNPPERQFQFTVVDSHGSTVPLTESGRAVRGETPAGLGGGGAGIGKANPGFGIKPGGTRDIQIVLNKTVDFREAGTYTIYVRRDDPSSKTAVESNVITVTLTE